MQSRNRFYNVDPPAYLSGPVAGLPVEVKNEAGRAADGCQGVATSEVVLDAADGVAAVGLGRQPEVLLVRPVFAKLLDHLLEFLRLDPLVRAEVEHGRVVLGRAEGHEGDGETHPHEFLVTHCGLFSAACCCFSLYTPND